MLYKSLGVVLVLIIAYSLGSFIQVQLGLSFNSESLKSLQNWIETYERSASIIFFLLVTFRIFIGLSSHIVLIIGGLIFGLIGGTILGALGLLASALMQFYIAKIFGAEWMRSKLQGSLNSIEERIRVYGALPVFLITAHPIGPQTPINLAGGLLGIPIFKFFLAIFFAAPIRSGFYSVLGAAALNFSFQDAVLIGLGLLMLAILPFFIPGFKKSAFHPNELNPYNKHNNHG